jgi:hypothetical protein
LHAIRGGDVVPQEHRDAVQRPANAAGAALAVALGSDRQCVRVDLDDRVDSRAVTVDGLDAREAGRRQPRAFVAPAAWRDCN